MKQSSLVLLVLAVSQGMCERREEHKAEGSREREGDTRAE